MTEQAELPGAGANVESRSGSEESTHSDRSWKTLMAACLAAT